MMKKLIIALAMVFVPGMLSTSYAGDSGAFQGVKIGGGLLWNDRVSSPQKSTGGAVHVSMDFRLMHPLSFTPFYEYSRRNGISTTLAGGEFHYNVPVAERATFYFGPGLGFATAGGKTKVHLNGVGGVKYGLTDTAGLFLQGKYAWAADGLLNGITAHGGLTFTLSNLMK